MQDYNEPFGDWLRRRIYARGLNLRQAARLIGTSGATMSHWVNGTRLPNPEYAQKLATLLLVSEEEMYVRTGHRRPRDTDQHPVRAQRGLTLNVTLKRGQTVSSGSLGLPGLVGRYVPSRQSRLNGIVVHRLRG